MKYELDFTSVIDETKELFMKDWVKLSLLCFAMTMVFAFLEQLPSFLLWHGRPAPEDAQVFSFFWSLILTIPQACFMLYIFQEIFYHAKNVREPMTVPYVLRYFVTNFITQILTVVAFMLCIIPGFFIGPRLILAPLYIVDNPEMGIGEAIERSWKATEGNVLTLLGVGVVACVLMIIGVILCCIGMYPAMAFTYVMLVVIYKRLSGQDFEDGASQDDYEETFVIEEKTVFRE